VTVAENNPDARAFYPFPRSPLRQRNPWRCPACARVIGCTAAWRLARHTDLSTFAVCPGSGKPAI
jgi:hypothetical protein